MECIPPVLSAAVKPEKGSKAAERMCEAWE